MKSAIRNRPATNQNRDYLKKSTFGPNDLDK